MRVTGYNQKTQSLTLVALGVALLASACGSEDPVEQKSSLFPLAVGNRWVYRITDVNNEVSEKIQQIKSSTKTQDGLQAFVFRTDRGTRATESLQRIDDEGRLLRVQENGYKNGRNVESIRFNPPSIRVDTDKTAINSEYTQEFQELHIEGGGSTVSKRYSFMVLAVDEQVTVPAGTFRCVKIRRETTGEAMSKTFWYAAGVGKVKEAGGQTEELESFTVSD